MVIVCHGEPELLRSCLTSLFRHAGGLALDVAVVDNSPSGEPTELLAAEFPGVRALRCDNHGFAHGSNRAYLTTTAATVLFLNPDTEIRTGALAEVVAHLRAHPEVGIVSVRQLDGAGRLHPTMRRFPTVRRVLMDAIATERLSGRPRGLRVLDPPAYDRESECDWVSGSFMLCRREAIEGAGLLDERFFLYQEETDLCLRVRRAGWRVVHLPAMTITHLSGRAGHRADLAAQAALSWRLYLDKNFPPVRRITAKALLALNYTARTLVPGAPGRAAASRAALATLVGLRPPPFEVPPPRAVAPLGEPAACPPDRDAATDPVSSPSAVGSSAVNGPTGGPTWDEAQR